MSACLTLRPWRALYPFLCALVFVGCARFAASEVPGLDPEANRVIRAFLADTRSTSGRKVAVFDGDGTVVGQVPHYLADECMYEFARKHPDKHPDVIRAIKTQSNVSLPYVRGRVRFFAGETLVNLRELGRDCYRRMYSNKVYPPMRALLALLRQNGFEVWIITASPEGLYQGFLSDELGVPLTNIVGVKSVVRDGIVTDRIVEPVPQDEGKREAIETFVQEVPLIAGGNSRGDREMIEHSRGLKIIVNPDEHVAEGDTQSMAEYAREKNWLILRIRDVAEPGFPAISSQQFGVRLNKSHE